MAFTLHTESGTSRGGEDPEDKLLRKFVETFEDLLRLKSNETLGFLGYLFENQNSTANRNSTSVGRDLYNYYSTQVRKILKNHGNKEVAQILLLRLASWDINGITTKGAYLKGDDFESAFSNLEAARQLGGVGAAIADAQIFLLEKKNLIGHRDGFWVRNFNLFGQRTIKIGPAPRLTSVQEYFCQDVHDAAIKAFLEKIQQPEEQYIREVFVPEMKNSGRMTQDEADKMLRNFVVKQKAKEAYVEDSFVYLKSRFALLVRYWIHIKQKNSMPYEHEIKTIVSKGIDYTNLTAYANSCRYAKLQRSCSADVLISDASSSPKPSEYVKP